MVGMLMEDSTVIAKFGDDIATAVLQEAIEEFTGRVGAVKPDNVNYQSLFIGLTPPHREFCLLSDFFNFHIKI